MRPIYFQKVKRLRRLRPLELSKEEQRENPEAVREDAKRSFSFQWELNFRGRKDF